MQKYIISLMVIASLTGCASSSQVSANNDALLKKEAAEEASWSKLDALSAEKCDVGTAPPVKGDAVELSNCVTSLVDQYVLPNAVFPELLLSSRKEALRIAQDYDAGKMTTEEYKIRSRERLKNYRNARMYFANQRASSSIG